MTRATSLIFLLVTTTICLASAPVAHGGSWRKATPDDETRRRLDAAVDRAAESVSWIYRGVARPKLAEQAAACAAYTFAIDTDNFQVQCDDKPPFAWRIDHRGAWSDPKGKQHTVELRRSGDAYTLTIDGDQGGKRWVYSFMGGQALRVEQRIFSPHLGQDMVWTLDYAPQR
jgi:hypothetical protein